MQAKLARRRRSCVMAVALLRCSLALLLSLTVLAANNDAAKSAIGSKKILIFLPAASPSHHSIFSVLMNELMERGHFVTIVSSGKQKVKHPHLREILVRDPLRILMGDLTSTNRVKANFIRSTAVKFAIGEAFAEVVFESREALALKKENFDLVISTPFIYQEPFLAFAHLFGCPSLSVHPLGYTHLMNEYTGGATNPAYVPNYYGVPVKLETLFGRLENTISSVYNALAHHFYYLPKADARMRAVFPNAPPITELLKNISLTLITTNNAVIHAVPLAPSVIEIAGIHIKPGKPLPEDLRKWIEDSIDGFVYFSLGSNIKTTFFSEEKREAIFRSFGKLKQRVLVKWNGEIPPHSENCRFEEWLPQVEILAHPNLKVFISHGGLLSLEEAVYSGAAVIGMPVFGDQAINLESAVKLGFAVQVSIPDLTSHILDVALQEVINNSKYREKSKELSARFRLDPLSPLEKAIYYIEQLIKLGNFKHLQPSSVDLPWYQYMLLDVIAVIVISLYIVYRVICFISISVLACCCKSPKTKRD